MGLINSPLIGRRYTWSKGKSFSGIDRALVEMEWCDKFLDLRLKALNKSIFDHSPLMLEAKKYEWDPKSFRTLNAWFTYPGVMTMVREGWGNLRNISTIEKLCKLKQPLKRWNKEVFGRIDQTIYKFEEEQT